MFLLNFHHKPLIGDVNSVTLTTMSFTVVIPKMLSRNLSDWQNKIIGN